MRLLRLNIVFLVLLPLLFSCSEYQKALKSDDFALKYELAKQQFNEEEYAKAVLLLEDILPFYRTSTEAEKVYYMYAYCQFAIGNNIVAAHHFKTLYDTYPYGKYSEQCLFNFAYCNYLESPPVNLDQSGSKVGIEAIQLFINKFPDSDKVEECNKYIDELNKKLEDKAVYTAKLYYKLEDFKAAIWTINDVIDEYPLTETRLELEYMILDSYYNLAVNSVDAKKEERYKDVISFYDINKAKFLNSKYASQAENIYSNTKNSLKKIQ